MLSRLERSTPEAEGVSSRGLKACLDRFGKLGGDDQVNSFMVLRHGKVIHENYWRPYRADLPHKLFSLSKSFTSTAVGFAISEGLFGLDDHVTDLFPDKMPSVISDQLKEMTVRHLLTMSCGQKMCYATQMMVEGVQDWQKAFFEQEIPYKPGTTFVYNSLGTYMLSALVTRKTGLNLVDYLMPRLFEPLGIARPIWETCPAGIATGGWGLSLTTEDIAKFGQLCLQKGKWDDQQLVPAEWLAMATSKQMDNSNHGVLDWAQGYGFQFWLCQPEGVYRGDGAYGQYCIVMPKQDMVVAMTESIGNMQNVLTILWDKLLPAVHDEPLPEDAQGMADLYEAAQNTEMRRPVGFSSCTADLLSGDFAIDDNPFGIKTLGFRFERYGCRVTLVWKDGTAKSLSFGRDGWRDNADNWCPEQDGRLSAGAMAWTGDRELTLLCCGVEGPFRVQFKCKIMDDGTLHVDAAKNYCFFGASQWPKLIGHRI
ncbi:MAG: serine hydrolase [Victivallales bacterium]|nr:serine hydrolase [Victivallales bacterium]